MQPRSHGGKGRDGRAVRSLPFAGRMMRRLGWPRRQSPRWGSWKRGKRGGAIPTSTPWATDKRPGGAGIGRGPANDRPEVGPPSEELGSTLHWRDAGPRGAKLELCSPQFSWSFALANRRPAGRSLLIGRRREYIAPHMESPAPRHRTSNLLRKLARRRSSAEPAIARLQEDYPRSSLVLVVQTLLDERRAAARAGRALPVDVPLAPQPKSGSGCINGPTRTCGR